EDDVGCPVCSFWADNFDPIVLHLKARDVTMIAISRAPFAKIAPYKERLGWGFKWVSSFETVFNYAMLAPRNPDREGASVFAKDESGNVFHTYSTYARGIDLVNTAYNY